MRFIHIFLVGYFLLLVGVFLGLWKAGLFARVDPFWIVIGGIIAAGLGVMLAVAAGRPTITEEFEGK